MSIDKLSARRINIITIETLAKLLIANYKLLISIQLFRE